MSPSAPNLAWYQESPPYFLGSRVQAACTQAKLDPSHDTHLRGLLADQAFFLHRRLRSRLLLRPTASDILTANPHILDDPSSLFTTCMLAHFIEKFTDLNAQMSDESDCTSHPGVYCAKHYRIEMLHMTSTTMLPFACGILSQEDWLRFVLSATRAPFKNLRTYLIIVSGSSKLAILTFRRLLTGVDGHESNTVKR